MPLTITHTFVSAKPAGGDATQVDGPKWNATHAVSVTGPLEPDSGGAALGSTAKPWGDLSVKRIRAKGTALVAGDFALSGWGAGAAVSAVLGNDGAFQLTVTAGTAPSASPTITLTFKDGTWTTVPICFSKIVGGTGSRFDLDDAPTATTWVITLKGTPISGDTFIIVGAVFGL